MYGHIQHLIVYWLLFHFGWRLLDTSEIHHIQFITFFFQHVSWPFFLESHMICGLHLCLLDLTPRVAPLSLIGTDGLPCLRTFFFYRMASAIAPWVFPFFFPSPYSSFHPLFYVLPSYSPLALPIPYLAFSPHIAPSR